MIVPEILNRHSAEDLIVTDTYVCSQFPTGSQIWEMEICIIGIKPYTSRCNTDCRLDTAGRNPDASVQTGGRTLTVEARAPQCVGAFVATVLSVAWTNLVKLARCHSTPSLLSLDVRNYESAGVSGGGVRWRLGQLALCRCFGFFS